MGMRDEELDWILLASTSITHYLSQHGQELKGLDGQVLRNEEHAVVGKVKAFAAALVVPEPRVPAGVGLVRCVRVCYE